MMINQQQTLCSVISSGIILLMLPYKQSSKEKPSNKRYDPYQIYYNLTEQSGVYGHNIQDLTSNGSSSQKRTNNTDASLIKCKKVNNKEINLRTEPHHQYKKIQDAQEKYISARNKIKKVENDSNGQTIDYTNRNSKKQHHIATEAFNNTGKLSHQTEVKYRQQEDISALQSKTTTRRNRRRSQHNNTLHQSQGHSRVPSFHLKSPQKISQKAVKKSKSGQKQMMNKTVAVTNLISKNQKLSDKKLKPKKVNMHLQINKIEKTIVNQALEFSNFSYGQHSKSEPDLYHRLVETEEVSFDKGEKEKAVNIIKKHWKIFKKREIHNMYSAIFSKSSQKATIPTIDMYEKKPNKKIPSFHLQKFSNVSKQITISEQMNEEMDNEFNVNKYVNVAHHLPKQQEEQNIYQIKRKNRKLEKQLLKFKEKQLDLCQKFQSVLLSSSQNINAQQLLQLIKMYKTEATIEKKSSSSSISYKQLVQQKGIAQKIANNKNPILKSLLDNEESFLKHKISSKSISEEHSSLNLVDPRQPTFSPARQQVEENSLRTIETRQLLSTYLDCQLGNIPYQKESNPNQNDLIKQSIDNQIQQFSNQENNEKDRQHTKQLMYELAKSQQFHNAILSTICLQFCEEIEKSPSIIQNIHYIKQIEVYNKTLQIKVSLPDIIEYLKGLIQHVLRNKKATLMILENINKPLGSTSSEILYYLRPNHDQSQSNYNQNPYNFIIPMGIFQQFENINRSIEASDSQQGVLIHYFWHRALYELFNELLDKKRPYGLTGRPYVWNKNLFQNFGQITFQRTTKIFEGVLNQILEILTFPTGLMFDSPLCQYYQCELSEDDKAKINQDRMWLIICEEVIEDQLNYHHFEDEIAEVKMFLAEYIQDLIFFEAVVDYRKLGRQRFLLSI